MQAKVLCRHSQLLENRLEPNTNDVISRSGESASPWEQGREAGLDSLSSDDEDIRAVSLLDKTASEAEPRISSFSVGGLV
jgi:hypothetical protein